jgi:hypothetical protein
MTYADELQALRDQGSRDNDELFLLARIAELEAENAALKATRTVEAEVFTPESDPDNPVSRIRPFQLVHPCSCGCDQRDNARLVGYLHAINDGEIVNIYIYDEAVFQALARAIGQYTQPAVGGWEFVKVSKQ